MKKQTALLLSALALMATISMQPANAFSFHLKKSEKPAVVEPCKEVAPVKTPEIQPEVKKEVPVAKTTPVVPAKPAVKTTPCATKPCAKTVAKPCAKSTVKPCAKAPVKKAPVKK